MMSSERHEIRTIIKFCHDLGKTPTETLKMIDSTQRKHSVSRALVFKWHQRFSNGQESVEDGTGRGRKKKCGKTAVTSIREAIEADRRLTVRALAERFDLGYGTVQRILTDELQLSKVS